MSFKCLADLKTVDRQVKPPDPDKRASEKRGGERASTAINLKQILSRDQETLIRNQ